MIIGARVEQRVARDELDKDRDHTVAYAGIVVACERAGAPASYHALILLEDGSLHELPAELLTIVELCGGARGPFGLTKPAEQKP